MKQLVYIAVATLLVSTASFADVAKNSPQLNALTSAWKGQHTISLQGHHDINMVYGGADIITRKPTTVTHIATA